MLAWRTHTTIISSPQIQLAPQQIGRTSWHQNDDWQSSQPINTDLEAEHKVTKKNRRARKRNKIHVERNTYHLALQIQWFLASTTILFHVCCSKLGRNPVLLISLLTASVSRPSPWPGSKRLCSEYSLCQSFFSHPSKLLIPPEALKSNTCW